MSGDFSDIFGDALEGMALVDKAQIFAERIKIAMQALQSDSDADTSVMQYLDLEDGGEGELISLGVHSKPTEADVELLDKSIEELTRLGRVAKNLASAALEESTEEFGPTGDPKFVSHFENATNVLFDALGQLMSAKELQGETSIESYFGGNVPEKTDEQIIKLSELGQINPATFLKPYVVYMASPITRAVPEGESLLCPYPKCRNKKGKKDSEDEVNDECCADPYMSVCTFYPPKVKESLDNIENICPVLRPYVKAAAGLLERADRKIEGGGIFNPANPIVFTISGRMAYRCILTPGCRWSGQNIIIALPTLLNLAQVIGKMGGDLMSYIPEIFTSAVSYLYLATSASDYLRWRSTITASFDFLSQMAAVECCRRAYIMGPLILERYAALSRSLTKYMNKFESHEDLTDEDIQNIKDHIVVSHMELGGLKFLSGPEKTEALVEAAQEIFPEMLEEEAKMEEKLNEDIKKLQGRKETKKEKESEAGA